MIKMLYVVCVILLFAVASSDRAKRLKEAKESHDWRELSDAELERVGATQGTEHLRSVLSHILVPRVVGTPNHTKVGNFIVEQLVSSGWDVEQDVFSDRTPHGNLNFRNIIARLNPGAERFLVLACHYDSKYEREHFFVGATDSAVPCAMLLNLAHVMRESLERARLAADVSLALLFFDGEEAFRSWGPTDSIYGARHLAARWQRTALPEGDSATELHRIDILVLLDLLGAPDPNFYSFFPATHRWYTRLAAAEDRLAERGLLTAYSRGVQRYFQLRSMPPHIEDDHIPFLKRGVRILHCIATPFPEVWHTPADDESALDFNTIDNLNKIFRVFVAEYLHLEV